MRAAVMQQLGEPLAVVDLDDPTPGEDEVVVRVEACGICGSDLHLAGTYPLPGVTLGHEFCGEVVAVGPGVADVGEGDRVAALPLATCGRCGPCLTGRPRKCVEAAMIGIERAGGYAELAVIPGRSAFRLPASFDARLGALVEPLAVGLHAVERAGLVPGDDVLVIGGGPVGLAVAVWLGHLGAGEVVVSDPVPARRDLAVSLGATGTLDPGSGDVGEAFTALTGSPAPVVIECVGIPGMIQHATDVVATDGRVVIAGVCMQPDTLMPLVGMQKELDLRFAFYYRTNDYLVTIDMIDSGRLDPLPLVTDEISLDDVPERFEALKSPNTEGKVLIRP